MSASRGSDLAVLVGATGDFGRAIARRLTGKGLTLLAVGRTGAALEALAGEIPGVVPCVADIAEDDAVPAIRSALTGPVRIAVHGPGLAAPGGVLEVDTGAMAASVNIKVGGMLRLARAVDGHLDRGSRLVGIGGHYGLEPTAYAAAAGVANAALFNVVRQLALALGPRGITAHSIAPGPADTARLSRVVANQAERRGVSIKTVIDELGEESAIGGLVDPAQVAWAIAMLLDPEAEAMTGSTLMIDGGRRKGLP
ncbi:MAG: SDR family oxidoreductase [Rhodospirillum sp.]|nr:SDR family oxidoreductase [Rhodospirillum sp.]MCF8488185.1 SDR family oxidoreductase [Rhodospirillum sp.]